MEGRVSDPECLDAELAQRLESLHRTMKANPRDGLLEPKSTPAKIVQLPLWAEPIRGAPNTLLRSAFFAAIHSKKRRELGIKTRPEKPREAVIIAAQDGIRIKYAGTQLNQYDADVFFEALHRARGNPLPTECIFRGYDFLKAIGRQHGNREYEDLSDGLTRLRDGRIELEWKINGRHYTFVGGLINNYIREENSRLFKVTFAKEIRDLFAPACWTQLEWNERMVLKGKPLAQWLHSFYSTHAAPYPLTIAYLHEKSGSQHSLLKNFRIDLKHALVVLEKVLGWQVILNGDTLTITRQPSASQIRHLNQKAARIGKGGQRHRRRKSAPLFDFPELAGS
jgi:TrfA protein